MKLTDRLFRCQAARSGPLSSRNTFSRSPNVYKPSRQIDGQVRIVEPHAPPAVKPDGHRPDLDTSGRCFAQEARDGGVTFRPGSEPAHPGKSAYEEDSRRAAFPGKSGNLPDMTSAPLRGTVGVRGKVSIPHHCALHFQQELAPSAVLQAVVKDTGTEPGVTARRRESRPAMVADREPRRARRHPSGNGCR